MSPPQLSESLFIFTFSLTDALSRFTPIDPVQFRVGDLVEVQMTASAVSVKGERFKMVLQLFSLALLDSSYSVVRPVIYHVNPI